jgi:hypothetical protein
MRSRASRTLAQREFQDLGLILNVARAGSTNSDRLRDVVQRFQRLNDELLVTDVLLYPADSRTRTSTPAGPHASLEDGRSTRGSSTSCATR